MIELKDPPPKQAAPALPPADIYIAGKKVGEVKHVPHLGSGGQYHASIEVGPSSWATGLAQGFGLTKLEAIADAFASSRKNALAYIEQIDELERRANAAH